jgi:hypothetical protein
MIQRYSNVSHNTQRPARCNAIRKFPTYFIPKRQSYLAIKHNHYALSMASGSIVLKLAVTESASEVLNFFDRVTGQFTAIGIMSNLSIFGTISDGFQRQSAENTPTARNERFLHSVGLRNYIVHHNINISNQENFKHEN